VPPRGVLEDGSVDMTGSDGPPEPSEDAAPDVDATTPLDRGPAPDDVGVADALPPDMAMIDDMAIIDDMTTTPDMIVVEDMAPPVDMGAPVVDAGPPPELILTIAGVPLNGQIRIEPVRAGDPVPLQIEITNNGPGMAFLDRPAVRVQLTGAGEFTVDPLPQQPLAEGTSRPIRMEWSADPGEFEATVTVNPVSGPLEVSIIGVAYAPVHAGLSPTGQSTVTDDLGANWTVPQPDGPEQERGLDIACGGQCVTPVDDLRSSARCLSLTFDDTSILRYTDDGVTWVDVEFDGEEPPRLIALDYGPPWVATDGVSLWQSEDGASWSFYATLEDEVAEPPAATDIAVNHRGHVFVTTSGGPYWLWRPETEEPMYRHSESPSGLVRVASDPDGNFLAVGRNGRSIFVSPNGDPVERVVEGEPDFLDVGHGVLGGESQFIATSDGTLWSHREAVRGLTPTVLNNSDLRYFAAGETGIVGNVRRQIIQVASTVDGRNFVSHQPPVELGLFAAGRLCPPIP